MSKPAMTIPIALCLRAALLACTLLVTIAAPVRALDGYLFIHDPSSIAVCDGTYYIFGTGRGIPIMTSGDAYTWKYSGRVFDHIPDSVHSVVPKNNGADVWAPDIIMLNGQYYMYYAVSVWDSFVSAVGLITSPTLNPADPNYKWTDHGVVVNSLDGDNLNAIDPCAFNAPDGTLWLSYGSYHGNIQLVQLDPITGLRISPKSRVWIIANQSEASYITYENGYYYLLLNHGTCCQGANSTYNIRVGRSKKVTGPYLDKDGMDMARGGGSLFLDANGKQVGPGQFARFSNDGVDKFSCHFESDQNNRGRPTLAIRPLLWTAEGWPEAGTDLSPGIYRFLSQRTGTTLQAAGAPGDQAQSAAPSAVVTAPYLVRNNQTWNVAPAAGGCYEITSSAGGLALEQANTGIDTAAFTGADNQLWKIDQLSDGSYRLETKSAKLALTVQLGRRNVGGLQFLPYTGDDTQKWMITAP
jgi:arabinan endo-1,5-alpha-L-arabinosidase